MGAAGQGAPVSKNQNAVALGRKGSKAPHRGLRGFARYPKERLQALGRQSAAKRRAKRMQAEEPNV